MSIELRALARADLPAARLLLALACAHDDCRAVAEEKLFGLAPGPAGEALAPTLLAAFDGADLAGVVASSGQWIRILAVHPAARERGIGTALLAGAESTIAASGAAWARTLDQPGNYLAPGIDISNRETIAWLGKRGYQECGTNTNLVIDVASNARVSRARATALASAAATAGYEIRRATGADAAALSALATSFTPAWAFEIARGLDSSPIGVHLAWSGQGDELAGFAVHDGNNQGLGWFGPAGTAAAHRRRGLGEALLLACLADVADAGHKSCTIAWIGPRAFYERCAGISSERQFVVLRKDLRTP